jgi:octopine/nopaline transport system substrate-binding protein
MPPESAYRLANRALSRSFPPHQKRRRPDVKLSTLLAVAAVALGAVLGGQAQAKDWKKVVIATEGAYPPYNLTLPDGKLAGFEIDLAANICPRVHLECSFIATDWNGVIPGLLAGKYDAIMDGMSITPKRREVIAFSTPYTQSPSTFAVLRDGPLAHMPDTGKRVSLDDKAAMDAAIKNLTPVLKGRTVGVQVSTIQADLLNTYFKNIMTIRTYGKTEEHDLDLYAHRVDLVMASTTYFVASLNTPQGKQAEEAGPLFVGGLLGEGAGIGLRKSDPELKMLFDKALAEAKADGTLKALSLKWFKTDVVPQ